MTTPIIGNFQWMKSLNRSLVLNTIRSEGPISRADIAKKTALAPPTVTNIVNELLEERFIVESEVGLSSGGRKPILLKLNDSAYSVIGVDVGVSAIRSVMTDLNASVIAESKRPLPPRLDQELFLATLKQAVYDLLRAADPGRQTIGIGIGMHGLVDPDRGISVFAPNMGLRNIPLREELEREFSLPVHVENDAVAMAIGELWHGSGKESDHFICVNIGVGVGAGIVLNRQIYRGASFTAGEIGHTTVDLNGPRCSCGNFGCLQTLVSGPAIAEYVQKEIAMGRSSLLAPGKNENLHDIDGEAVCAAALAGDELSIESFRKAGRLLGISLTNLIHTLNPQKIILGGGVAKSGALLLEPLMETIHSRALESAASKVEIEVSRLGDQATAIGAATIELSRLFAVQMQP
jgi:glucokinase-like ROK family protein